MLKDRIIPALGGKRLSQIRPVDINKFIRILAETGKTKIGNKPLSARTIRNHFMCLSSMFQQAIYCEFIANNPCKRVKPPKTVHEERKFMTDIQVNLLLNELTGEDLKYQAIA